MNDLMIFCTCSEINKEYYLKRVLNWYNQLNQYINFIPVKPEFYVFTDGYISTSDINKIDKKLNNIHWINNLPILGRQNIWIFPGWKRSFQKALELGNQFKYLVHIESDILLLQPQKIINYFLKPGYYCGWCNTHKFIESSLMILNDKNNNNILINRYSQQKFLNEKIDFERNLMKMFNWNIIFNGDRIEGNKKRFNPNYDFIGQIY